MRMSFHTQELVEPRERRTLLPRQREGNQPQLAGQAQNIVEKVMSYTPIKERELLHKIKGFNLSAKKTSQNSTPSMKKSKTKHDHGSIQAILLFLLKRRKEES